jgi:hypothetical protein
MGNKWYDETNGVPLVACDITRGCRIMPTDDNVKHKNTTFNTQDVFIEFGVPTETAERGHFNLTLMGIGDNTNKNIIVLNVYGDFFMTATIVCTNVTIQ